MLMKINHRLDEGQKKCSMVIIAKKIAVLSCTVCNLNDDVRVDSNYFPVTIETPGSASKEAENFGKLI